MKGCRSICVRARSQPRSADNCGGSAFTDLVDRGHLEPGVEELREMANGEAAHADAPEEPLFLAVDRGLPAVEAHRGASDGPVKEVEIDVAQPAIF